MFLFSMAKNINFNLIVLDLFMFIKIYWYLILHRYWEKALKLLFHLSIPRQWDDLEHAFMIAKCRTVDIWRCIQVSNNNDFALKHNISISFVDEYWECSVRQYTMTICNYNCYCYYDVAIISFSLCPLFLIQHHK